MLLWHNNYLSERHSVHLYIVYGPKATRAYGGVLVVETMPEDSDFPFSTQH